MAKKFKATSEIGKGSCRVCGGDIVEKIVQKSYHRGISDVIGPSSGPQFYDAHEGYYCKKCGLKYEFVQGKDKDS